MNSPQVYYNDIDPYCCKVLQKNIRLGNLPEGYVDGRDIREVTPDDLMGYNHIHLFAGIGGFPLGLRWANFPASIRILTGGFPCQDISVAGKRTGIEGSRSGLWSEMYRLICGIRPEYILVENVAALLYGGIDTVLGNLAACGYDAEWQVLSAEAFGAPHLRERVFIVGYPMRLGCGRQGLQYNTRTIFSERSQDGCQVANAQSTECEWSGNTWRRRAGLTDSSETMADPDRQGLAVGSCFGSYARQELATSQRSHSTGAGQWAIEPNVGRVANGVPHRVDRLRGLGNALVAQIIAYVARCIMLSRQMESAGVA